MRVITIEQAKTVVRASRTGSNLQKAQLIVKLIKDNEQAGQAVQVSFEDLRAEFPDIICFNSEIKKQVQEMLPGYTVKGGNTRKEMPKYIQEITVFKE